MPRVLVQSRPPRGGRGLKYKISLAWMEPAMSPPSRGAWIEIADKAAAAIASARRPPRGGRGLKCLNGMGDLRILGRPPRGGRGLKSQLPKNVLMSEVVAPLAGGVD